MAKPILLLILALALCGLLGARAARASYLPPLACTGVIAVNQTASTDLHTFTNKGHICAILLISASAQSVSLAEGTGTTCGTGTTYLAGGAGGTIPLAANGGFSAAAGSPFMVTQVSADHLCLLQSGSANISGWITYNDSP
jgi:hypothetical protein